ncbi:MAG: hypothetical protein H0U98_17555 [Alphaproteobacteria bacterium]|nr:hypothetical protein [Alphaproteobacteria bacterium]
MGRQKKQLLAKANDAAFQAKMADWSVREAWLKIAESYRDLARRQPY